MVLVWGVLIAGFKRSAYDVYVQRLLKTIPHTKTLLSDVSAPSLLVNESAFNTTHKPSNQFTKQWPLNIKEIKGI